jgi:CO dehydrogenase/acetyl-CoA synthase beta subunit
MVVTEKDLEDSEKLPEVLDVSEPEFVETVAQELAIESAEEPSPEEPPSEEPSPEEPQDFQTVDLCLDTMSLEPMTNMQLKNGKEIYYKMYREARQKAKLARDLAISSYLESKHIKNIYVLEDLSDDEEEKFFSLSLSQRV